MAITTSIARPKLVGTVTVSPNLIAKPIVEEASYFEFPICFDNLQSSPVSLTEVSFTSGSPTVTGLQAELAKVKVGSVFVSAADTADFATGTYVIAKPTPTTLTLSTNALQTQAETTATTTLTVDATAAIVRVTPVGSSTTPTIKLRIEVSKMDGSKATDSNGNGYDEAAFADGIESTLGTIDINFDTFATAFGLNRTNA